MPPRSFIQTPDVGAPVSVLTDSRLTDGALSVSITTGKQAHREPLRVHRSGDTAVVILEGNCDITAEKEFNASAGDLVFVPAGVRHRVTVRSQSARWLTIHVPAGPEQLAAALQCAEVDGEAVLGLAADCGVELVLDPSHVLSDDAGRRA